MESLDPSTLQVIGGFLVLAVVFVIREFASGALKKAGEEFWTWARHRRTKVQVVEGEAVDSGDTCEPAEAGRRSSKRFERGLGAYRPLCLLPLGRGEAGAAAIRRPAIRPDAPSGSERKSA